MVHITFQKNHGRNKEFVGVGTYCDLPAARIAARACAGAACPVSIRPT
jgi:hypothetical protein